MSRKPLSFFGVANWQRAFTFRVHFFLSTILSTICTAQNGVLPVANNANSDILVVVHRHPSRFSHFRERETVPL
ncbi:hypothetical protein C8F01DRAFT_1130623 [Mycena amicta]|nr:hypothetical protein C8F01DRAFT_1130623 [Mycena amicta]